MYHVQVARRMYDGYIRWFYIISHPQIIALEEDAHIRKSYQIPFLFVMDSGAVESRNVEWESL